MNNKTVQELRAEIMDLRVRRDALLSLDKDQQELADAREKRDTASERKEALSGLGKSCRTAIKKQMDSATAIINETVRANLPADWEFELVLADGSRDAFWPGLWQKRGSSDKMLTVALSGSEDATVLGAFSALAAKSRPDMLSVLSPDDVGWDAESLFSMLKGFSGYPGQVIVCSTTWPARRDDDNELVDDVPADWAAVIMPDGISGS